VGNTTNYKGKACPPDQTIIEKKIEIPRKKNENYPSTKLVFNQYIGNLIALFAKQAIRGTFMFPADLFERTNFVYLKQII